MPKCDECDERDQTERFSEEAVVGWTISGNGVMNLQEVQ